MLDDVAAYLILAPAAASLALLVAAALWAARSRPAQARVRARITTRRWR
jgi:hypothetical protein